jgi:hypothetical protein
LEAWQEKEGYTTGRNALWNSDVDNANALEFSNSKLQTEKRNIQKFVIEKSWPIVRLGNGKPEIQPKFFLLIYLLTTSTNRASIFF